MSPAIACRFFCLARDDYPLLLRSLILFTLIAEGELIGSFLYPSDLSLASCTTTSCLCKSCQRTLSSSLLPSGVCHRFSESECKGTTFSRTGKIFQGLFSEKDAFLRFRWQKSRKIGDVRGIWAEVWENERKWEGRRAEHGSSEQIKEKASRTRLETRL